MSQLILNMQNEFEGKTVEDAIALGLSELGLSEAEADVEIVDRGSRGIFGIGSSTALVRITKRTASSSAPKAATSQQAAESAGASISAPNQKADDATGDTPVAEDPVASSVSDERPASEDSGDGAASDQSAVADQSGDFSADELYDEEEISDDELSDMAMDMLGKMVSLMGYDVEITAMWRDPEPGDDERVLMLDVSGDNLGALIGRHGETLGNLQYLLRLMVNQKVRAWCNIVVDVANYKSRRADQLMQLAHRVADQVIETGRSQSLEPMPSNERRIVHLALREHADVYTESTGDSDRRRVHIVPKSLTS